MFHVKHRLFKDNFFRNFKQVKPAKQLKFVDKSALIHNSTDLCIDLNTLEESLGNALCQTDYRMKTGRKKFGSGRI